jgi:hypothetical protein
MPQLISSPAPGEPFVYLSGVEAMKLSCLFWFGLLSFVLGCATEEDRRQWDEAMKDARGENMEMRNNFSTGTSEFKPLHNDLP